MSIVGLTRLASLAVVKKVSRPLITSATRHAAIVTTDPRLLELGHFPKTEEERKFAAAKYNLIPEDYEPYPEGEALGDYPMLPHLGQINRDLYDDYEDPTDLRHYGEPMPKNYPFILPERYNPNNDLADRYPLWFKLLNFVALPSIVVLFVFLMDHYDIHVNHPWKMERQYGAARYNLVNYDFPKSKNDDHHHH